MSFLHNFADDVVIVVHTNTNVGATATDFVLFLGDFQVDAHVGTEEKPISKTVAIFFPWNEMERIKERGGRIELGNGKFTSCEKKVVYLGCTFTSELSDDTHLQGRMSKAAQVFGALRSKLLGRKDVWRKVKRLVFESMIIPTLLDGVECSVVSLATLNEMTSAHHRMIRGPLNITPHTQRKYRLTSETLLHRLDLAPLHHYVDMKVLGFVGHVQRMPSCRLPRQMRDGLLHGARRTGGQYKTHIEFVHDCITRKGITNLDEWKALALDKNGWRKLVLNVMTTRARATTKKSPKFIHGWIAAPASVLGHHAEKKFQGKWYGGKVVSFDLDIETNETIWCVRYDDGETEDYNASELAKVLCDNFDASD